MGKRGPRPQPTQLKILRGNPGNRPINKSEPQPEHDGVVMPLHLGDVAASKWNQVLPLLQSVKVMTRRWPVIATHTSGGLRHAPS